ncbi:GNAT family N-acetyltransferase [Sphaerisporangium perillae]|uniref:GNAT family N-acetyltransferase n=1 Tax=Sphaerisporangium perillae TaxID=2935860 RepID=UPI00200C414D|nr:GNAT family N-acetyltransferase [Sphaerisporangium perillae]
MVLALFDRAVEWLVALGLDGQWGSIPWSAQPKSVAGITRLSGSGGMRVAEIDGVPVGAMWLGDAPDFVPAVCEPEIFIDAFVVDRRYAGHHIGQVLLDQARTEATGRGIGLLRLDCWAGGDQKLIRYYERAGFTRAERFTLPHILDGWEGQVLTQRIGSGRMPHDQ